MLLTGRALGPQTVEARPSCIMSGCAYDVGRRSARRCAQWSYWRCLFHTEGLGETLSANNTALSTTMFSTPAGCAAMMDWYARALEAERVEYESFTVPTRYGDTHVLAAGPQDATPVVLLHGMEGNAASWRHQLVGLQHDFRLYALDIIGSAGKSVPTRLSHDNDDHAKWLGDVLTALGIEKANLVGMSNGSWLVLKFAGYAPHRIERAALMSASGIVPVRFPYRLAKLADQPIVSLTKDVLAGALLTRGLVRRAVSGVYVMDAEADPHEIEWFYLLAKYYRFRFPPGPVSDEEIGSLTAPTLLLMGEQEKFFPLDAVIARATRFIPHLTAEVVGGVGHNMCTDNPTLINNRLRAYFPHVSHVENTENAVKAH